MAALAGAEPGVLVLVDGLFDQSLAVGHAELREAITAGWKVFGLGSMGAVRACEMRHHGMIGFGRVYEHFLADEDFQDDEVALLHTPAPDYRSVSEPLVHLRHFLRCLDESHRLSGVAAQRIADELKAVWYGHRTLEFAASLVDQFSGGDAAAAAHSWLNDFDRFRVKGQDLTDFLRHTVWLRDSVESRPQAAPYSRTAL